MDYGSPKAIAIAGVLIFIAIVINFSAYLHLGYAFGGDQGLNSPNLNAFLSSFFIWQPNNYSGLITPVSEPLSIILYATSVFYIFGLKSGYIISTSIYYWLGAFGMFLLIYNLDIREKRFAFYGGIISAIFLSFEFSSHLKTLTSPIIFLPYVVLSLLLLIRALNVPDTTIAKKRRLLYFSLLSLSAGFLIATGGYGVILQNFILLVLIFVLAVLLQSKNKKMFAKYTFVALAIALLINSSIISTTYIYTHKAGKQFFGSGSTEVLNNDALPFLGSIVAFGNNSTSYYDYSFQIAIFVLAIIGAIVYVYMAKRKEDHNLALILLVVYLFFVGLTSTIYRPFGLAFKYALNQIPYLLALRYPYFALHYIALFLISTFIGMGFIGLMEYSSSHKKSNRLKYVLYSVSILALFVAILLFYLYMFDIVPIMANSYQAIPNHVFQIANYINAQNGDFTVGMLPPAIAWQIDSWYIGTNVYSSLIHNPVYTGGYTNYNEIFFPPVKSEYFNAAQAVGIGSLGKTDLSNIFGIFGIKYIVYQGDALNYTPCGFCFGTTFLKSNIFNYLSVAKNIHLVASYGNSSIYESSNYVPLVYASNLDIIQSNTTSGIYAAISNSSFAIQNYSLYDPASFDGYSPIGKMVAYEVRPFSKPNVSFDYSNPTYVVVHVSNATTPFYLVFRESYDPSWSAYFSNGTEISPSDHLLVNGFANAWYIGAKGSYTIHIYYTLQTYADIAWVVSFAALFATIGIGAYGWKESKRVKARMKKRK